MIVHSHELKRRLDLLILVSNKVTKPITVTRLCPQPFDLCSYRRATVFVKRPEGLFCHGTDTKINLSHMLRVIC